jgi:hypothetical protein
LVALDPPPKHITIHHVFTLNPEEPKNKTPLF